MFIVKDERGNSNTILMEDLAINQLARIKDEKSKHNNQIVLRIVDEVICLHDSNISWDAFSSAPRVEILPKGTKITLEVI